SGSTSRRPRRPGEGRGRRRGDFAVKLGLLLWNQDASWPEVVAAAQLADRVGYDSVWMWDHLYSIAGDGVDPYRPIFEGWTSISALAALTEHVRLGLLVGANAFR